MGADGWDVWPAAPLIDPQLDQPQLFTRVQHHGADVIIGRRHERLVAVRSDFQQQTLRVFFGHDSGSGIAPFENRLRRFQHQRVLGLLGVVAGHAVLVQQRQDLFLEIDRGLAGLIRRSRSAWLRRPPLRREQGKGLPRRTRGWDKEKSRLGCLTVGGNLPGLFNSVGGTRGGDSPPRHGQGHWPHINYHELGDEKRDPCRFCKGGLCRRRGRCCVPGAASADQADATSN